MARNLTILLLLLWMGAMSTQAVEQGGRPASGPAGALEGGEAAGRQSISERVRKAAPGDTITVEPGIYTEGVITVDKPLSLLGLPGAEIRGAGDHELLVVQADDVTIRGIRFSRVDRTFMEERSAIRVAGASGCRVLDNAFEDTFFGVYLAQADGCEVRGNTFRTTNLSETTGGNAIHAWYSRNLRIAENVIEGFRDAIYLEFTEDSHVQRNHASNNLRYGLHFMFSDRCTYTDNVFQDNRAGVAVMYADGVSMTGNTFSGAWGASAFGLLLKEIKDGDVRNNLFVNNSVALLVEATDRMAFSDNTFRANGWALKLMANATGNRFTQNTFEGNTFDVSTNSRKAYSTFSGNYWDRYEGYDLDRDGVGDVAYRPVSLFSILVERHEPALYLYRSVLVDILDAVEALLPALTPENLTDTSPLMERPTAPLMARPTAPLMAHPTSPHSAGL